MRNRVHTTLQKALCLFAILLCSAATFATNKSDLKIFSSLDRDNIEAKIESQKWASEIVNSAHQQVDKYVKQHTTDPEWIISRLQMYWKNHYTTPYINGAKYSRAEGSAPVPTVRFTGARDWATSWATPSIEDIVPYMDYRDEEIYLQNNKKDGKPWEWVKTSQTAHQVETINCRIMERAMNAAFIYWLKGDQRYAKFAYDILMKYVDGMYYREAPISEIDHRSSHIVGLTSFEVIHERVLNYLPLCYDFLGSYIAQQPTAAQDKNRVDVVLKKFAEQMIKNGVPDNNWNVFQACFLTYIALPLSDDSAYADGRGKQYYIDFILNQNAPRQKSLREVFNAYDQETGMWHESPGYSVATTKDIVEILLLIDGVENKDILKEFPIIETATLASFEYLHPNMRTTAFGDNQYMSIDGHMYETLLSLYSKYKKTEKVELLSSVINDQINEGVYNRNKGGSLYKLFNYVDSIDPKATSDKGLYSTVFYAPNVNLTIQRNGMNKTTGLMSVNAGTGFNHCNNNGINLELYGRGYPLGVDKARGSSYWHKDHREYYNATVSHNTVLIDGVSNNNSTTMKGHGKSKEHKMLSAFPAHNQKDAKSPYSLSYVDNEYFEKGTKSAQRRLTGIVRTSPTTGYYVDIFRSRKVEGGDKMHEYIYHNLGQSLTLFDTKGKAIAMNQSSDLTSAGGKVKGYDYLTDKYETTYTDNFRATFELNLSQSKGSVMMDVWMQGETERKLFSVMTPPALKGIPETSKEISNAKIPALIVRQTGEAWSRPFVAIYEPYTGSEGNSIESVEYLDNDDSDFVGVVVSSRNGTKEYILNATKSESKLTIKSIGAEFQAIYGIVSTQGKSLTSLFMGKGSVFSYNGYAVSSSQKEATALVEWADGSIIVTCDTPITLTLPKKDAPKTLSYSNGEGKSIEIPAVAVGKSITFALPALERTTLTK